MIIAHLDVRFYLTKLLVLSRKTREFFGSLNSALLDTFIRSYGLCSKLRRSNLAGKLSLIPFLAKLEKNMMRAEEKKRRAD